MPDKHGVPDALVLHSYDGEVSLTCERCSTNYVVSSEHKMVTVTQLVRAQIEHVRDGCLRLTREAETLVNNHLTYGIMTAAQVREALFGGRTE